MTNLIVFLVLLFLGYAFGQWAERRHFKSILRREKQYANVHCFSERFPPDQATINGVALVVGSVVISIDYFKRVSAGLRMLFGGRVSAYESLLERARREAILRMKEEAIDKGASSVFNVKIETSSITKGSGQQIGSVEVYVYGTAIIR